MAIVTTGACAVVAKIDDAKYQVGFSQEDDIFTLKNISVPKGYVLHSCILYNKSPLTQQKNLKCNGLVFHWCLYNK